MVLEGLVILVFGLLYLALPDLFNFQRFVQRESMRRLTTEELSKRALASQALKRNQRIIALVIIVIGSALIAWDYLK